MLAFRVPPPKRSESTPPSTMADIQATNLPSVMSGAISMLTFLAGFGSKWVLELVQHRRLTAREREARHEARRDLLLQRRSDFQRQNLIELQEACSQLLRTTGQTNHHDVVAFNETNEWQKSLLPEEVSEGFRRQQSTATLLSVRVRDSEIRRLTEELQDVATVVAKSSGAAESERSLQNMAEIYRVLNQRIGVVLRELEDTEVSGQG